NGSIPQDGMRFAPGGSLYGTCYSGGASNLGTVFRLQTDGTLTLLAIFTGTNGANPSGTLALAGDGNFYGTTFVGGLGYGTIFKLTTNGDLTVLVAFNSNNGKWPRALLPVPDGTLYGITTLGGIPSYGQGGFGTVFQVSTNGLLTEITALN